MIAEPWRTLPLKMKLLEPGCALILGALASTDVLRTKIINEDGIGCVLQSFQRVPLRRNSPISDTSGSTGLQQHNDLVLKELYDACLEFMLRYVFVGDVITRDLLVSKLGMVHCTHCQSTRV